MGGHGSAMFRGSTRTNDGKGRSLQEVANFVSARLAPLDGVLSTATHFMLKTYKDQGVLMESEPHDDRLQVCP